MFVYIGKNPRFMAFLDSNLHTRLAIVTENELGLAFPHRNLPKKFRPDLSTFYLVIVVTNRQTNAGDSIIPHFRGDNHTYFNKSMSKTDIYHSQNITVSLSCWRSTKADNSTRRNLGPTMLRSLHGGASSAGFGTTTSGFSRGYVDR